MMSTRAIRAPGAFANRANSSRRIRRANHNRLFCSTNGCASFLVLDAGTGIAHCPVCGLERRVH
jgi:hypothetical protein